MKVDGSCLCKHVTYEATVDPQKVIVCHCTDCQTHSGTAYRVSTGIVNEEFRLLTGRLKSYEKIAESGTIRALAFCPECGTNIYSKTVGEGSPFFALRVGTVKQRAQLIPKQQVWCRSAEEWSADLTALPRHENQPFS
ncbi:MAG: glutathione-dependent formaldehyde-activating protein [Acidiferrobacteraceae bacterium]|nr:glutathione-dependent formaldehyde-activating protein [Acidiferrobacteraceae bacterium]